MRRTRWWMVAAIAGLVTACTTVDEPGVLVPGTVDEDPTLPAVDLAGTRFHLETRGVRGRPLAVMLHGGPGADYSGLLRLERLADTHHVVFFDQRGAGLSRREPAGSNSMARSLEDLAAIIDAYGVPGERVTLVGHSWGGWLATAFVTEHPERVGRVVLIDPGPFTSARWTELGLDAVDLSAPALNAVFWSESIISPDDHARLDFEMALLLGGPTSGYNMATVDRMPFPRYGGQAYRDIFASLTDANGVLSWDVRGGLAEWDGEALYISAGNNDIMSAAYHAAQVTDYPRIRAVTIPDVGHDLVWVKPDEVLAAIAEVLP